MVPHRPPDIHDRPRNLREDWRHLGAPPADATFKFGYPLGLSRTISDVFMLPGSEAIQRLVGLGLKAKSK